MSVMYSHQDLDLSLLNEIADGSDEFIIESIDMFLQQTPELLQSVGNYLAQKDWAAAASSAHKLKATLGFFGMLNSQALIQQIELGCKAGAQNPAEILTKFNQVKANVAVNSPLLKNYKAEAAARL